ncbi:MAG: hypothetical protein V4678_04035 [Patescibacteria group bacterium]
MTTPDKCTFCPREAMARTSLDLIEVWRDIQTTESEAILDDATANELAEFVNGLGILPGITMDAGAVRQVMLRNFELIEELEAAVHKKRDDETKFCVGALRLRAKDHRTEYTVSVCRSPQPDADHTGDIQLANVQKRTI